MNFQWNFCLIYNNFSTVSWNNMKPKWPYKVNYKAMVIIWQTNCVLFLWYMPYTFMCVDFHNKKNCIFSNSSSTMYLSIMFDWMHMIWKVHLPFVYCKPFEVHGFPLSYLCVLIVVYISLASFTYDVVICETFLNMCCYF